MEQRGVLRPGLLCGRKRHRRPIGRCAGQEFADPGFRKGKDRPCRLPFLSRRGMAGLRCSRKWEREEPLSRQGAGGMGEGGWKPFRRHL